MKTWIEKFVSEPINVFTALLAIVTFALVVVGFLQWQTLDKTDLTLRLQQRAWAIPVSAVLDKDVSQGLGIKFGLFIINGGREPARNVDSALQVDEIDSYDPSTTDTRSIKVPDNRSCQTIKVRNGGYAIPPNNVVTRLQMNSVFSDQRYVASERVVAGEKFAVVQGCLAYDTVQDTKVSSFCFVIERHIELPPTTPIKFLASTCGSGFSSD